MRWVLSLALVVLLSLSALAESISDCVPRVECVTRTARGVSADCGDGVCIRVENGYGLVLTAAHVVKGKATATVTFPSRKRYEGQVVATDDRHDLAAVLIRCPEGTPYTSVAEKPPATGDVLWLVGDATDNDQPIRKGRRVQGRFGSMLEHDIRVSQGDSGGGVFNERGQLVSITSGYWTDNPRQHGHGADTGDVRAFVGRVKFPTK